MNQATDPWTTPTWTIADVSEQMHEVKVNGSFPQFQLERQPDSNPAVYALKPAQAATLPSCLAANVLLTEAGTVPPGPVNCETLLAIPFAADRTPYWDVSNKVVGDERDLLRLEGVIQMSDGPKSISLYQVDNVLTGNRMLLVVDIGSPNANPDGTLIGHN
jgi:hypothetical protein